MAIRQDNGQETGQAPALTLKAVIAGLALTLAFAAAQSPFI